MGQMVRGRLVARDYCRLLGSLHCIYDALERGLGLHAGHAVVALVHRPPVFRLRTLESDLEALQGPGWRDQVDPVPAARAYATRLRDLTETDPALLVAHAYVRYLGDLNGGQVLRRIVGRALGLRDGVGCGFYDFGSPEDARAHALALRAGLDRIPGRGALARRIVAEARSAFAAHSAMFDQLAAG